MIYFWLNIFAFIACMSGPTPGYQVKFCINNSNCFSFSINVETPNFCQTFFDRDKDKDIDLKDWSETLREIWWCDAGRCFVGGKREE